MLAVIGAVLVRAIWFSGGIAAHSLYMRWNNGRKCTDLEELTSSKDTASEASWSDYDLRMEREDLQDSEGDPLFVSKNLHEGRSMPPFSNWGKAQEDSA